MDIRIRANNDNRAQNILGEALQPCYMGYIRNGICNTSCMGQGTHVICAIVTEEFLAYTKAQGNDLTTPMPQFDFPGLKAGDGWCVCAKRWYEAHQAGVAPPIQAQATHEKALKIIPREILDQYRID